mmetsp:Transcript_15216/g.45599  ORF Transcript_15216/g.45599 Transcript_15216/m.45599 type:complete len:233 (-) Transcript_15216:3271-3969(-)
MQQRQACASQLPGPAVVAHLPGASLHPEPSSAGPVGPGSAAGLPSAGRSQIASQRSLGALCSGDGDEFACPFANSRPDRNRCVQLHACSAGESAAGHCVPCPLPKHAQNREPERKHRNGSDGRRSSCATHRVLLAASHPNRPALGSSHPSSAGQHHGVGGDCRIPVLASPAPTCVRCRSCCCRPLGFCGRGSPTASQHADGDCGRCVLALYSEGYRCGCRLPFSVEASISSS